MIAYDNHMGGGGEGNFVNQTIWTGDNLDILRGFNSECIDLIYLDPPFNSNANYAATIGSLAAGVAFKDTWGLDDINLAWHGEIKHDYPGLYSLLQATRDIHGDSMMSYLIYMAIRIMELRRVLKPTGSIYLHCDSTAGHHLKLLMDAIFGKKNFRNEIVWCYTGPGSPNMRQFNRKHDTIYWYSIGETWVFNADTVRINHHGKTQANFKEGLRGSGLSEGKYELANGKVPETWWAQEKGNGFAIAARQKGQCVGYPTQKPIALLRRITRASSNEGDMILDPFCGCAIACIAAELENRQWVGIDISPKAADLVEERLMNEVGVFHKGIHHTDIPQRTDIDIPIRYNDERNKKYLYGE